MTLAIVKTFEYLKVISSPPLADTYKERINLNSFLVTKASILRFSKYFEILKRTTCFLKKMQRYYFSLIHLPLPELVIESY